MSSASVRASAAPAIPQSAATAGTGTLVAQYRPPLFAPCGPIKTRTHLRFMAYTTTALSHKIRPAFYVAAVRSSKVGFFGPVVHGLHGLQMT